MPRQVLVKDYSQTSSGKYKFPMDFMPMWTILSLTQQWIERTWTCVTFESNDCFSKTCLTDRKLFWLIHSAPFHRHRPTTNEKFENQRLLVKPLKRLLLQTSVWIRTTYSCCHFCFYWKRFYDIPIVFVKRSVDLISSNLGRTSRVTQVCSHDCFFLWTRCKFRLLLK